MGIILHIFSYSSLESIASCSLTCKKLFQLSEEAATGEETGICYSIREEGELSKICCVKEVLDTVYELGINTNPEEHDFSPNLIDTRYFEDIEETTSKTRPSIHFNEMNSFKSLRLIMKFTTMVNQIECFVLMNGGVYSDEIIKAIA